MEISKKNTAPIWAPAGLNQTLATLGLMPANLVPRMSKGGTIEPFPGVKITMVHADHSSEMILKDPVTGKDTMFGKGETRIDIEIGDPKHQPNPCFGAVGDGPYCAIQILPGDGSTTVGVKIDAHCRVLGQDGQPIPGLWAAGLDANSIWQGKSPAHGCNVGPAMITGYIAARSIAA